MPNKYKVEFTVIDNEEYEEGEEYSSEDLTNDLKSTLADMNLEIEGEMNVTEIE